MRRKDYYTKRQIAMAWVKKKLGIVSPSALYVSNGKYKYAYDYIMKKGASCKIKTDSSTKRYEEAYHED